MILIIDNYDSFTYNIYQILATLGYEVRIIRNNELTLQECIYQNPEKLLISPGPGTPIHAGISLAAIQYFSGRIPVFGVCLGHQALAQAFGGKVVRADKLMHGKTSTIHHTKTTIFKTMPTPFTATRYHSLLVNRSKLPSTFNVTAWTDDNEIMGLHHQPTGAEGVQFHPESVLTEHGTRLLNTFASL